MRKRVVDELYKFTHTIKMYVYILTIRGKDSIAFVDESKMKRYIQNETFDFIEKMCETNKNAKKYNIQVNVNVRKLKVFDEEDIETCVKCNKGLLYCNNNGLVVQMHECECKNENDDEETDGYVYRYDNEECPACNDLICTKCGHCTVADTSDCIACTCKNK